jgi:hypothetical protein
MLLLEVVRQLRIGHQVEPKHLHRGRSLLAVLCRSRSFSIVAESLWEV